MRRNRKSRILAILLVVSMIGSSAIYVQAAEVSITPAAEAEDPDMDVEICGEEHEMKEVQVVEPTCTEAGYVLWKCPSCGYEEKRDLKKALGHDLEVFSTEETTEDTLAKNRVQREKKTTRITTKTITRETVKSRMCQLIRTKMIRLITMVRQSRIPEMNPAKILIRQRNQ